MLYVRLDIKILYLYIMRNILFILFILLFAVTAKAQKVFSVEYASQADVKVFVAEYESRSDLSVYKVDYESRAGKNDGNWFFVDYASQADVIIYFAEYSSRAGWRNKEKKHLFY